MENLQTLTDEALQLVEQAEALSALDQVRVDYLGKKGCLLYTSPSPRDRG